MYLGPQGGDLNFAITPNSNQPCTRQGPTQAAFNQKPTVPAPSYLSDFSGPCACMLNVSRNWHDVGHLSVKCQCRSAAFSTAGEPSRSLTARAPMVVGPTRCAKEGGRPHGERHLVCLSSRASDSNAAGGCECSGEGREALRELSGVAAVPSAALEKVPLAFFEKQQRRRRSEEASREAKQWSGNGEARRLLQEAPHT